MRRIYTVSILLFTFILFLSFPELSRAYYTNMPATLAVGQSNLTSNSSGTGSTKFNVVLRSAIVDPKGRFIVLDRNNNRILVWNAIPTRPDTPADLVLCQSDFSSVSANRGSATRNSNTCNNPTTVTVDNDRLIVVDESTVCHKKSPARID